MSEQESTLDEFVDTSSNSVDEGQTWEVKQLRDLVNQLQAGGTPDTNKDEYYDGEIAWVKTGELGQLKIDSTEQTITEQGLNESTARLFPSKTVLIAMYGATTGELSILDTEAATNQACCGIIPNNQIIPYYLYYQLIHGKPKLRSFSAGSGQQNISKSILEKYRIPVAPLSEQRKIATVLYTVDQAIEKTEEIISEIEVIKDGLIQDLFTDGYFTHDEKQGDQWAKFPKDWELISVGELIDRGLVEKIMDGNHGERHPTSDDFVTAGIPFVTSNVVKNSQVRWSDCKCLEQHTVDDLRKGFAKPNDVLLTHKGHVGRVGKVPESVELAVLSPQVTYYRCTEGISPDFLMYYFLSSHVQKQLQAHSAQTTRDYVGITKQRQIQLALPLLKEQEKIVEVLSSVDKYFSRELRVKSTLRRLKRGLMQYLLSGTVRTTDTNIRVPDEVAQHG